MLDWCYYLWQYSLIVNSRPRKGFSIILRMKTLWIMNQRKSQSNLRKDLMGNTISFSRLIGDKFGTRGDMVQIKDSFWEGGSGLSIT